MDVIPVIDLKAGHVVHARRGDRAGYRPIATPLSATAEPLDIVRGLLSLHPFRRLYVADLDAIAGAGDHRELVRALSEAQSALELWVDRGIGTGAAAAAWRQEGLGPVLLGSESAATLADHRAALAAAGEDAVLSLDFRGDDFQGPGGILEDHASWPGRVIVMTLARVGSGEGPDLARLQSIKARAGRRRVYAAGGVRDLADLRGLAALGIEGALVATSLHDGRLGRADLGVLENETGGVCPAGP